MNSSRVTLEDTMLSALVKMYEGNIGAITVLTEVMKRGEAIDPDSALGGFGVVLNLDYMGVYGSHIWILYKYVCGENIRNFIGLLRAHQLGFLGEYEIKEAIKTAENNQPVRIDVADALAKVEEQLPNFKAAAA